MTIGDKATLTKKFTEDEVKIFAEISLDSNPIHIDELYASNSIFKNRIVHGFLVGSLISATIANKLPGNGSVYISQTMNFKKPVYLDEEIMCIVEITNIINTKSIYELNTNCYNELNEVVIEGKAVIKLLK